MSVPKAVRKVLKEHGLALEETDEGDLLLVKRPLDALGGVKDERDRWFIIECQHEVFVTYRVLAASFDEALEQLCGKDLFQPQSGNTFGPDEWALDTASAQVVEASCSGDPIATGSSWTQRDWVWHEED